MPLRLNKNELYVVVIKNETEREMLKQYCKENNISIPYPSIFKSKKINYLYGLTTSAVGLTGTMIARHTPKDHIIKISDLMD